MAVHAVAALMAVHTAALALLIAATPPSSAAGLTELASSNTTCKAKGYNFDQKGLCACNTHCSKHGDCCPDYPQTVPQTVLQMTSPTPRSAYASGHRGSAAGTFKTYKHSGITCVKGFSV